MRIFYASDTTPNAAFESNLWRNNLYLPLIDLGHDVIEFDYDLRKTFQQLDTLNPRQKKFIEKNRPIVSKILLEQIKKAHAQQPIDLFFSYFYDACVLPEVIDEIKSLGIKTVNWYCNGSYQLHLVSQIAPHYDYCLVPEKFRLKNYKRMGAQPIYCQEAANPTIYKPYTIPYEYDVTFVGQAYGERPDYIQFLLNNNIDVRVWGIGWDYFTRTHAHNKDAQPQQSGLSFAEKCAPYAAKCKKLFTRQGVEAVKRRLYYLMHPDEKLFTTEHVYVSPALLPSSIVGGILSDTELVKMYSRSKINLSFSTCGNTHVGTKRIMQIRLRDFEVPMSGGFFMTEYFDELEEFFDIGKEIVCYENKQDLVSKIAYYLKHDAQRERIRKAGHERCLRDHTWHKRFAMAFDRVFENAPSAS